MKTSELKETAELLRYGAAADIWYDAKYYDEVETVRIVGNVQQAMLEAAEILDKLRPLLDLLHDLPNSPDWTTSELIKLAEKLT